MACYEGININLDPHGSATARSVNLLTDRLQMKSILNPETFASQTTSEWDAQADCDQIFASIEKSRERKGEAPYDPSSSGRITRRKQPSQTQPTQPEPMPEPVDKTPMTIAQLMGWDENHVPTEQTASPIVPAAEAPAPKASKPAFEPAPTTIPDDVQPAPVSHDVVVEFGEDGTNDASGQPVQPSSRPVRREVRHNGVLYTQEKAIRELNDLVEQSISDLDICAPRAMTLEMLVTMARNEWLQRRVEKEPGIDRSTLRLPQDEFARKNLIVNFIKHELVFPRYDGVVSKINSYGSRVPEAEVEKCYVKWRLAVIDKLSEAFPMLANTANAQRLRRYDIRTKQLVAL